jgi:CarD family transcriptional regulator
VTKAKEKAAAAVKDQTRVKTEEARHSTKAESSKSPASLAPKSVKTTYQETETLTLQVNTVTVETIEVTAEVAQVKAPQAPRPSAATPKTAAPAAPAPKPAAAKPAAGRPGFKLNEFVVYPAHGVGQIVAIEEQEVAGFRLELYVISFSKDKMTLRVPTSKVAGVGLRKISDGDTAKRSLEILAGRARIKRTMWSRRAQEYESKINSGDIGAIAEVIRDLYRSDAQPEQSYSERQLYEAALDRLVREIAAVQKLNEIDALKTVESHLQKGHGRAKASPAAASETSDAAGDSEIEEAA